MIYIGILLICLSNQAKDCGIITSNHLFAKHDDCVELVGHAMAQVKQAAGVKSVEGFCRPVSAGDGA